MLSSVSTGAGGALGRPRGGEGLPSWFQQAWPLLAPAVLGWHPGHSVEVSAPGGLPSREIHGTKPCGRLPGQFQGWSSRLPRSGFHKGPRSLAISFLVTGLQSSHGSRTPAPLDDSSTIPCSFHSDSYRQLSRESLPAGHAPTTLDQLWSEHPQEPPHLQQLQSDSPVGSESWPQGERPISVWSFLGCSPSALEYSLDFSFIPF